MKKYIYLAALGLAYTGFASATPLVYIHNNSAFTISISPSPATAINLYNGTNTFIGNLITMSVFTLAPAKSGSPSTYWLSGRISKMLPNPPTGYYTKINVKASYTSRGVTKTASCSGGRSTPDNNAKFTVEFRNTLDPASASNALMCEVYP